MVINLQKGIYGAGFGNLGLISKTGVIRWYGCREEFHRRLKIGKDFVFSCGSKKRKVIDFIRKAEKCADVPDGEYIELHDTNINGALYIKPGLWWSQQRIRLSLLTILLRCGLNYVNNFQSALFSESYTRDTKAAIDRFFNGNTWYLGRAGMWHTEFNYGNSYLPLGTIADLVEKRLIMWNAPKFTKVSEKSALEADKIVRCAGNNKDLLKALIALSLDKAVATHEVQT